MSERISERDISERIEAVDLRIKPLQQRRDELLRMRRGRGLADQDLSYWCAGCGARIVRAPFATCGSCPFAPVSPEERTLPPEPPAPVNRDATTLTDGSPVTEDHREINPSTGMQKGYVVLSAEERAKGFVRPVRRSYQHVGIRPKHPLRDLTPEEHGHYDHVGYVKFEAYPEGSPERVGSSTGRFWTQAQLDSGCGTVTTMGQALAETYARDPSFYGGTFCAGCRKHFPVGARGEFVWEGTDQRVGT